MGESKVGKRRRSPGRDLDVRLGVLGLMGASNKEDGGEVVGWRAWIGYVVADATGTGQRQTDGQT